jgi:hypothetical protein
LRQWGQERCLVVHAGRPELDASEALLIDSPARILTSLMAMPGALPRRVIVHRTPDSSVSPELLRQVARAVEDALHSRRLQEHTVELYGRRWLGQGLANLEAIASRPSIAVLRGAFPRVPCVVVSPGPSLSKNIQLLPELADRALLITGTHAWSALESVGARPDLVLAADAGDLQRHFQGVRIDGARALVVGATCHPSCFAQPARRSFTFASNGPIDDWIFECLSEDARLSSGGSVACSAFSLAIALGCDPIVLVGQDLSFPDGRFYAVESLDGDAQVERRRDGAFFLRKPPGAEGPGDPLEDGGLRFSRDQQLLEVDGYHGGRVLTSASFKAFLTWFEASIGALAGSPRVVNCTEGGARIGAVEQAPLAEVARAWPAHELDLDGVLERALARHDARQRRAALIGHVRAWLAALDPCLDLARRCRSLALQASRDPRALQDLGAAEKELVAALRPVKLFALVAQKEIVEAQAEARRASNLEQNLVAARQLFEVVERGVEFLREPLASSLKSLASAAATTRIDPLA